MWHFVLFGLGFFFCLYFSVDTVPVQNYSTAPGNCKSEYVGGQETTIFILQICNESDYNWPLVNFIEIYSTAEVDNNESFDLNLFAISCEPSLFETWTDDTFEQK